MRRRLNGWWREAKAWPYILAWALGVPIPILIIIYLLRGCA